MRVLYIDILSTIELMLDFTKAFQSEIQLRFHYIFDCHIFE